MFRPLNPKNLLIFLFQFRSFTCTFFWHDAGIPNAF